MKKEVYQCDRCGKQFDSFPKSIRSCVSKVGTKAEIDMIVEGTYREYVSEKEQYANGSWGTNIIYDTFMKHVKYDLCPKCRKDFVRFMKNEKND